MTCSMCFPSIVLMPFTKLLCLKPSVDAATANSHLSPQPSSKSTGTNSSTYKVKNKEFETGNSPCQPSLPVEEIKTGIFSTDFKNPPIQAPPGGRMWSTIFRSSLLRRNPAIPRQSPNGHEYLQKSTYQGQSFEKSATDTHQSWIATAHIACKFNVIKEKIDRGTGKRLPESLFVGLTPISHIPNHF